MFLFTVDLSSYSVTSESHSVTHNFNQRTIIPKRLRLCICCHFACGSARFPEPTRSGFVCLWDPRGCFALYATSGVARGGEQGTHPNLDSHDSTLAGLRPSHTDLRGAQTQIGSQTDDHIQYCMASASCSATRDGRTATRPLFDDHRKIEAHGAGMLLDTTTARVLVWRVGKVSSTLCHPSTHRTTLLMAF